jgi:hypothetical protein
MRFGQASIGANRRRDFQTAGEGVHTADVRVKEINRLEAFAANFGVEIEATPQEQACGFLRKASLDTCKIQAGSLCYFASSRRRGGSAVMVLPHDLERSLDAPKSNVA